MDKNRRRLLGAAIALPAATMLPVIAHNPDALTVAKLRKAKHVLIDSNPLRHIECYAQQYAGEIARQMEARLSLLRKAHLDLMTKGTAVVRIDYHEEETT